MASSTPVSATGADHARDALTAVPGTGPHGEAEVLPGTDRNVAAGPMMVAPPHPFTDFWRSFRRNKGAVAGLLFIVLLCLIAVLADVIAPFSPSFQFRDAILSPPAFMGGDPRFLLGTDDVGRDILSRILHGARLSLFIGFVVVTLSLAAGVLLGLLAGFSQGGVIDVIIMRAMDVLLALPSLLLAIVIVAILGPGLMNAMFAIAIVILPHYARLTRASVLSEIGRDYVTASRVAGAGTLRLMFTAVLPNCVAPLIVQATLGFSNAILDAAALGFLGLGAQPPTPEWGTMLANARQFVQSAWWVVTFPGLAILLTVLAFNLLGDGLRDTLDPRLKR